MTHQEWADFARTVRERAERVSAMLLERARQETARAGLDPSIMGIHVHNALVGLHAGRPWREVDYRHARRAKRLMERSLEPGRIAHRVMERAWKEVIQ